MSLITPKLFGFLRDLKKNNTREWFDANKPRFRRDVEEPLLDFIRDLAPILEAIAPRYPAIPKRVGGSLFRIYRDVRFSPNKEPFKTNAALHFRHERGKDAHAPGFYLHLEPGNVFAGCGLWMPPKEPLEMIRERIAEEPDAWRAARDEKKFRKHWELSREDTLKRGPKDFPLDHPMIEDLKLKSYVAFAPLTEKQVCADDFLDEFTGLIKTSAPFMGFLTETVGERWE